MTRRSTWALPYAVFLLLFVALPLILILFYAFTDGSGNFTLGNFVKFFTDTDAIETFALSLEVAIENTALCILLGYPAAWILANKKLNNRAFHNADVDQRPDENPRHCRALPYARSPARQGHPAGRYGL